jgi:hypothetical protein
MSVKLVQLLPEHLRCFLARIGTSPDPNTSVGFCLVDERGTPLACGGFEVPSFVPDGAAVGFLYLGPNGFWWKRYPRIGIEAVRRTFALARKMQVTKIFLASDPSIGGSKRLVRWLGAEHVENNLWVVSTATARF